MSVESRRNALINILYFSVMVLIFYLLFKYAFSWLLPFIIAFGVATVVEVFGKKISNCFGLSRRASSVSIVIVIYLTILSVIVIFGIKITGEVQERAAMLPQFYNTNIVPLIVSIHEWTDGLMARVAPQYAGNITALISTLNDNTGEMVVTLSGKIVEFFGTLIKNIPDLFITLFFTVFSTVLFVWDYPKLVLFIYKQLPQKARNIVSVCKNVVFKSALKMLKAYSIIMLLTFLQLLLGFLILGIEEAAIKALIIALADFLPLVGLSVIFIPWILICLIQKNFYLAIGLSVLFLIITVIRNFIEPKIVGKQIGLNPIVSLICFYVGLKLMGLWGILILPIVAILLKSLNDSQVIKLWKT